MQIFEFDLVDFCKFGGCDLELGIEEEFKKYVKQEDEYKWRCKVFDCSKFFKEEYFWWKYVDKRYGEWVDGMK